MVSNLNVVIQYIGVYLLKEYKPNSTNKLLIKIIPKKNIEEFVKNNNSLFIYRRIIITESSSNENDIKYKLSESFDVNKNNSLIIEALNKHNIFIQNIEEEDFFTNSGKIYFTDKSFFVKDINFDNLKNIKEDSIDDILKKLYNSFKKYNVNDLNELIFNLD